MTLTFNSEKYSELLSKYQPRIITSEQENEKFLAIIEELLSCDHLTPEEDAVLELLVRLIEDFEDKHYQLNTSTPHSRLLHLIQARSIDKADLVKILGSKEITEQVVNGRRDITKEQAQALGVFFEVKPNLFF